jgi:hypothetical protein
MAAKESLDIESLCDLIQLGEQQMRNEALKEYIQKHLTPEEQQQWKDAKTKAAGGDPDGYFKRWNDLIQRIQKALPLDPESQTAQDLLAEWNTLLQPFIDALDDEMREQVRNAPSVPGLEPIVREQVTAFISAVKAASMAK